MKTSSRLWEVFCWTWPGIKSVLQRALVEEMKVDSPYSTVLQQGGVIFFTSSKKCFLYVRIQPDFLYVSQVKSLFQKVLPDFVYVTSIHARLELQIFSYWLVIKNWFLLKICSGSRNLRPRREPFHYFIALWPHTSLWPLTLPLNVSFDMNYSLTKIKSLFTYNCFSGKAGYKCQEFSDEITAATSQTQA